MGDNHFLSKMKFSISNFQFPIKVTSLRKIPKRLPYYFRIWVNMSKNSFLMVLNQKSVLLVFLAGKVLRFMFFVAFLFFLVKGSENLAGYNSTQAIFFFLTFMVVDTTAQFLFREVYKFRSLVVSGDFDLVLVKPVNSLFRVLMGGADVIDLITLPPLFLGVIYVGSLLSPTVFQIFLYLILILTGILISTAFHIIVISFGIITLEVDHTIMIYRDVTNMGRFPVDIYKEPLKSVLTFFIPVAIMMSLPAKALMGLAGLGAVFLAIVISFVFMFVSLRFWNFALKKYSSASS
jgi:ABC-2 type transport system permease protein